MDVLQTLQLYFEKLILKGLQKGWFNEERNKLFAYTVLPVKDESFEDLYNFHLSSQPYSHASSTDEEKFRKYNDNGTYSSKDLLQLVAENIFKHVCLSFYGAKWESEWYIMYSCSYYEGDSIQAVAKQVENLFYHGFDTTTYQLLPEYEEHIDFDRLRKMVADELGRDVGANDFELIFSHIDNWPKEKVPKRREKQSYTFREFVGQPWVVGYVKQEEKSRINRAYEAYINEGVFFPLIRRLRIERYSEFKEVAGLYGNYYPLIYPHSKDYVLAIVKAYNENEVSRLYYFLYLSADGQLFEWTKPDVHEVPGHHAEWILQDIKDLSSWGDEFSFHEPSVTMDDPIFWNEHVLKQKDGQYQFLQPVSIKL